MNAPLTFKKLSMDLIEMFIIDDAIAFSPPAISSADVPHFYCGMPLSHRFPI
jgi:hypothetical protein